MRLYLVQHGEATSKEEDPNRPLTEKGKQDSIKVAGFLKKANITVDAIWHSPKTRAIETAGLYAREMLPEGGTRIKEGLSPNDPVGAVLDSTIAYGKDLMIVGHLPFLQRLLALALVGDETKELVKFNMAGVICLEENGTGAWQLAYKIDPDLL